MMDCCNDWEHQINQEQLTRVLELGEVIQMLPPDARPLRAKMMALKLCQDDVAASPEEAFCMLMEAYAHAEVTKILQWYEDMLMRIVPQRVRTTDRQVDCDA